MSKQMENLQENADHVWPQWLQHNLKKRDDKFEILFGTDLFRQRREHNWRFFGQEFLFRKQNNARHKQKIPHFL